MDNMVVETPKKRRKKRMKEPLTDELLEELRSSSDPARFADKHHITQRSLPEYLQQLLDEKQLSRPAVIREAKVNTTYGYEIFTGAKVNPARDVILQIVFGLGCTLQEANRVLQAAGRNELYCKNRRDAIIIFCLDHGYTLAQTDDELYRFGEQTIVDAKD